VSARRGPAGAIIALVLAAAAAAPTGALAKDTCYDCHRGEKEERLVAPTRNYPQDIHFQKGLTCASCHGGNPADPEATAMDPDKGFRERIEHNQIAKVCGSCHADAAYMKRFNPRPYIFSVEEFETSVHFRKASLGDTKVATCTSCHGVHGIRPHSDPASPVYAQNVPRTCAHCHNAEYMKGRRLPANQYDQYVTSVHGKALLEKGDLSAPACNDCHGNHGAAPPGLNDISMVCGSCHGREGELFIKSKMKAGMDAMGKRGCVTCHSNHGVQHPSDAMLAVGGKGVCGDCHRSGSDCDRATVKIVNGFVALRDSLAHADSLLKVAEELGMETDPGRETWKEAEDHQVGVRAGLHSFDTAQITGVLDEGLGLANRAAAQARAALKDWRNRRIGMGLSLLVILFLIGLLVLKIRQIEGR
jgi:predicted CXXCH cytochrome family protein